MKRYTVLVLLMLGVISIIHAEDQGLVSKKYHNRVIEFKEEDQGNHKKFTILFEEKNPACRYAPRTLSESLNPDMYRYFMPNTDFSTDLSDPGLLQLVTIPMQGVELLIEGYSVKKDMYDNTIEIIVMNEG